ncbi:putative major tail protein [Mycobacterium phage PP]|uniref:Putative major tail protein n=1 Tax=Mycobacterium phage PP TaxID=2077134 RepID=A0A2Z5XVF3_9CAUD|nr:putative major tail protein [Mycobacterium phage PP]BBC53826.1 putative major tail protein [Mycobacterium phage PP]
MAINDDAVLTAAVGHVYIADVGTAAPAAADLDTLDLLDPAGWTAEGWTSVGHTSRNDMPEFGFEGGDTEVRGTWQNDKLREVVTEAAVDYLILYLHQFDEESFALYFGANASSTAGEFAVGDNPTPTEKAFLVIIADGDVRIGFTAAKASIRREEAIQLPVDDFASLPIRATFLKHASNPPFKWLNEDLFPNA